MRHDTHKETHSKFESKLFVYRLYSLAVPNKRRVASLPDQLQSSSYEATDCFPGGVSLPGSHQCAHGEPRAPEALHHQRPRSRRTTHSWAVRGKEGQGRPCYLPQVYFQRTPGLFCQVCVVRVKDCEGRRSEFKLRCLCSILKILARSKLLDTLSAWLSSKQYSFLFSRFYRRNIIFKINPPIKRKFWYRISIA